jgi:hypothetical protein
MRCSIQRKTPVLSDSTPFLKEPIRLGRTGRPNMPHKGAHSALYRGTPLGPDRRLFNKALVVMIIPIVVLVTIPIPTSALDDEQWTAMPLDMLPFYKHVYSSRE